MPLQTMFRTVERAPVQNDNLSSGLRLPDQGLNVTTNTRNTGHFGKLLPVKTDSKSIGQLGRA